MPDAIALVNGQPLTRRDLDNAIQGFALQQQRKTMDQLSAGELRQATELALEQLLARQLLYHEALAHGVVASAAAVEAEQERLIANFPTPEEFFATLEKAGISATDYFRMLRQDLTVNLFSEQQLGEAPVPSAAELEQVWREQADNLRQPPRVHAAHLLVRDPGGRSAAARERCAGFAASADRENFSRLAREHSDCPSASAGGDLGWFAPGTMAAEFEQLAFTLPVGDIGGPVATQFGWHLVMVLEREEGRVLTREEAEPRLQRLLGTRWRARALKEWVARLAGKADIRLLDDTLPWPDELSSRP